MNRKDEMPKKNTINKKHPSKKGLLGLFEHIENKCCPTNDGVLIQVCFKSIRTDLGLRDLTPCFANATKQNTPPWRSLAHRKSPFKWNDLMKWSSVAGSTGVN
jgi:hypothetical protein